MSVRMSHLKTKPNPGGALLGYLTVSKKHLYLKKGFLTDCNLNIFSGWRPRRNVKCYKNVFQLFPSWIPNILSKKSVKILDQLLLSFGYFCHSLLGIFGRILFWVRWPPPQKNYIFQANFLIPPDIVSARMSLLVTLFLVLISIFNSLQTFTPNVNGE